MPGADSIKIMNAPDSDQAKFDRRPERKACYPVH